ncbi:hypothetical protein [Glycomyces buryatensis]|uniref:Uncharacterized protein n=1 Tax=Glycomyces buryatensis TaxID=2570927 RepID=A0A4S8Q5M4_9ACTN|nr:hypothetical protein [Glycomyces buryatensis]THV39607.1 hypothetical protein FAB82_17200 [Glycomyces buryatensis]
MSDRTIPRPASWKRDFVADFEQIADAAEDWAAAIEDAHDAEVTGWDTYTPGIIVHRTAAEYTNGTGVGALSLQANVASAYGFVLARYSFVCVEPWYAATLTLPTIVQYPPCIVHARDYSGNQVRAATDTASLVIGATGTLMAANMYLAAVRYTATGAPEAGDWILDHADEQLGLNTILTK